MKQLQKQGRRVKSLEKEVPEVWPVSEIYWEAFQVLSSRRGVREGGYPEFIPLCEIVAYADLTGVFPHYRRQYLLSILLQMDQVFVHKMNEKVTKDAEKRRREEERRQSRGK